MTKVPVPGSTLKADPDKRLKRTELRRDPDAVRDWQDRSRRKSKLGKRSKVIGECTDVQREKVRLAPCVVCGADALHGATIHPAHLASRPQGGGDDPLDVVPMCALHHREFDDGERDILGDLERGERYREEIAQCVRHMGLLPALRRLTGRRWEPV